jgi:hypothetical protein
MGIPYDKSQSSPWFYVKIACFLSYELAREVYNIARRKCFPPAKPIETPWDPRCKPCVANSKPPALKQDVLFLNLPLEIRLAIYQHILPEQTFHLSLSRYGGGRTSVPVRKSKCLRPHLHADSVHGGCDGLWVKPEAQDLLKLALVCRQMYRRPFPSVTNQANSYSGVTKHSQSCTKTPG